MIVCLCRRVCDRTIRRAIADGATTVGDVGAACGAGTKCGACSEMICEMIDEHRSCQGCAGEHCSRRVLGVLSPYLAPAGESA